MMFKKTDNIFDKEKKKKKESKEIKTKKYDILDDIDYDMKKIDLIKLLVKEIKNQKQEIIELKNKIDDNFVERHEYMRLYDKFDNIKSDISYIESNISDMKSEIEDLLN